MLVALPGVGPSYALDAKPEALGAVRLIETDAIAIDAGFPGLDEMLASGKLKVAARTEESAFLYATPGGAAILEANGIGARLLMEDATGSE